MTERFPRQRNRSAQRRADANQVRAVFESESTEFDDASSDDARFDAAVFDESFVAAAPVREPSAEARALQRHLLPDQRTGEEPLPTVLPRWSVRPSHHLSAVRPLPAIAALVCILTVTALLVILLA
jgi:hypothetical protein